MRFWAGVASGIMAAYAGWILFLHVERGIYKRMPVATDEWPPDVVIDPLAFEDVGRRRR